MVKKKKNNNNSNNNLNRSSPSLPTFSPFLPPHWCSPLPELRRFSGWEVITATCLPLQDQAKFILATVVYDCSTLKWIDYGNKDLQMFSLRK